MLSTGSTPSQPAPAPLVNAGPILLALVPLVDDLSRDIAPPERFRRLLQTLRTLFPCDAAALLKREGDFLTPLAVDGLTDDTLGRRFKIDEHPRFSILLDAASPTRFAADCDLPDPYDGLVLNHGKGLEVHDCMGCAIHVDGHPWGLLTLDALDPSRFGDTDLAGLFAFTSLAAATVKVSERLNQLASQARDEHERAQGLRAVVQSSPRALLGNSAAHHRLLQDIDTAGPSDLSVLITGETGTGKELVAQALHAASARAGRAFISINCAALPDQLVESELFGHVRGAFSGAVSDRKGKFEMADRGTLFLDEVGELSLAVQAKLLRVLQSGQLQRVGSDREHHVDVRLIAATNRDLAHEVAQGRYRADFFHRLSVFPMLVSPLRERSNDVLLLAGYFLEQNRSRFSLRGIRLSADAQAALLSHDWPGNVRELEHLISRSVLQARGRAQHSARLLTLTASDLGLPGSAALVSHIDPGLANTTTEGSDTSLRNAVQTLERTMISAALARHEQNWTAAGRELGIERANLVRLAKRLGLRA